MEKTVSPRSRRQPQAEYRFDRVRRSPGSGELVDPCSGLDYQRVIERASLEGWRFVQAIPTGAIDGIDQGAFDLVFERPVRYPAVVFGHVPKTAGSSITSMLVHYLARVVGSPPSHWLLYGATIPYADLRPIRQLPIQVRLVAGHFGSDHYQLLLRNDPFVLVSLRDPFERFLSVLEHEHRDAVACPEAADDDVKARYARLLEGIGILHDRRDDPAAMRAALEAIKGDYIPARDYLTYAGRDVAQAWIDCGDVSQLCSRLAVASSDPPAMLEALGACSHENVFPRRLFTDLDDPGRRRLRDAFDTVFVDECRLFDSIRRNVPHLFAEEAWSTFLDGLWRQPAQARG